MKKVTILISALALSFNIAYSLEEGLSYTKLPSGQKVVIKEVKDNNIVKIDTWINTGSINEDDKTTANIYTLLRMYGVNLYDHIIVSGTEIFSYFYDNRLQDIKDKINKQLF